MKHGSIQATDFEKKYVDIKALENPRCSLVDYGTVGCTKDLTGKGERLIIVYCIAENEPVPGALWIFPTELNAKQEKNTNLLKLLSMKKSSSSFITRFRRIKQLKIFKQLQRRKDAEQTAMNASLYQKRPRLMMRRKETPGLKL